MCVKPDKTAANVTVLPEPLLCVFCFMTRIKAFLASEYTGVLKRPWSRLLLSLQERLRLFIRETADFRSPRKNCRPKTAKSAFSCGAMSFQVVRGWPSCAIKHWRVAATSSCMLRIRLFCSTKASGVRATRRSGRFVRGRVCCCLRQPERGRSPVTVMKTDVAACGYSVVCG